MNSINLNPSIPKGLAKKILERKFGINSRSISDLFMHKIFIEVLNEKIGNKLINSSTAKKKADKKAKETNKKINKMMKYLRKWCSMYVDLAVQCEECEFNQKGQCSILKEKSHSLENVYKKCQHKLSKDTKQNNKKTLNN